MKNPNLRKFIKVETIDQLKEGMTLIDRHAHKRTILHISDKEIWLSHKYGKVSKHTGKSWPIDTFLKLKNWIFKYE